jgi:hypothetical protein
MTDIEKLEQFARDCWHELILNRGEHRMESCAAIGRAMLNGSLDSAFRAGWTPATFAQFYGPSFDPSFQPFYHPVKES